MLLPNRNLYNRLYIILSRTLEKQDGTEMDLSLLTKFFSPDLNIGVIRVCLGKLLVLMRDQIYAL